MVERYKATKVRLYSRGDAAFASPDIYEYLEAEGFLYAIRLPADTVLQESIAHLLTRPVGRPPNHVRRYYASFSYQAGSWNKKRRVVAKVEWHPGELYPRVGFIVTNLSRPAERVVAFYNHRGTAEQWIKEGKNAIKWTRLSCRKFDHNAVRLQLHALAYNLGNFMRTLALPDSVEQWSLTTLRQKLIKIGAKIVRHGRYVIFQMAEVAIQETSSPTSCAASTGSDRRSLRHDRRHPAHPRRRQDRCIWYAAEESVCPATPANCPSIRWHRITGDRRTQASCNVSGSESRSACR